MLRVQAGLYMEEGMPNDIMQCIYYGESFMFFGQGAILLGRLYWFVLYMLGRYTNASPSLSAFESIL